MWQKGSFISWPIPLHYIGLWSGCNSNYCALVWLFSVAKYWVWSGSKIAKIAEEIFRVENSVRGIQIIVELFSNSMSNSKRFHTVLPNQLTLKTVSYFRRKGFRQMNFLTFYNTGRYWAFEIKASIFLCKNSIKLGYIRYFWHFWHPKKSYHEKVFLAQD